jgi:predicted alpha/beta superfamily hydrolase
MTTWQPYTQTVSKHTVVGDLRVSHNFHSPQLGNERDVLVWLPPSYENSQKRYPVVYMHDGQNLFDAVPSHSGEWGVDETMTQLAHEGIEAIIVGLPNAKEKRGVEYSPYPFTMQAQELVGQGDAYIHFIKDTVKPMIDSTFRTRADVASTGIAGSSMGGLISLYGFLTQPDTFGFCGAFSTAYWFGENALLQTTRQLANGNGKIYLDVGTQEGLTLVFWLGDSPDNHEAYTQGVRDLRDVLLAQGYHEGKNFQYVEAIGALHNEGAWAQRLPSAMRFLLG